MEVKVDNSEFMDCPGCKKELPEGVTYCPHCGVRCAEFKMKSAVEIADMAEACNKLMSALPQIDCGAEMILINTVMEIKAFTDWVMGVSKVSPYDMLNSKVSYFTRRRRG